MPQDIVRWPNWTWILQSRTELLSAVPHSVIQCVSESWQNI